MRQTVKPDASLLQLVDVSIRSDLFFEMSAKKIYEGFADEMGGEDLQSRDKQNALKSFEGTVFLPPGVMNLESELLVSRLRCRKVNLLANVYCSLDYHNYKKDRER